MGAPTPAGHGRPLSLPPPVDATTLGVGDVFEMRIVGEDKLPTAFTVAPDGTVDLPYVKRLHVAGLEPQELAAAIRERLISAEILSDPGVSVSIKEYNSKRIEVLGEVQKPGSLAIQPGMTLLRAISLSGGFNSIADKSRVTVRRRVHVDPLTDLRNRAGIVAGLDEAIDFAKGADAHVTIFYVDLDGFKGVNDRWGHAAGDQVLIECARRLQALVRRSSGGTIGSMPFSKASKVGRAWPGWAKPVPTRPA